MVRVIYHGHSNLEIHSGAERIQLDPFYTSNPLADVKAEQVKPTAILVSHAHFDHMEDAEALAKRTGAVLISNHEIAVWFANRGVKNVHGMNHGGGHDFPFGRATYTFAAHTSSFPDGSYGGQPGGWIIETGGKTIYFAGDTAVFGDMALLGKLWNIDLACLPVGDNYTMGPRQALLAGELLRPKAVMLMHYNTFPVIQQDPAAVAEAFKAQLKLKVYCPKAGESFEL